MFTAIINFVASLISAILHLIGGILHFVFALPLWLIFSQNLIVLIIIAAIVGQVIRKRPESRRIT